MGLDMTFEGMGDLVERLESMVANAAKIEDEALKEAAAPILAEAQQTTAFIDRSHHLRDSLIVSNVSKKNGVKSVLVGSVGGDAFYAGMVEKGTSRAAAHPFLEPAFNHHKEEAEQIIIRRLQEALK
jgi:HK97 gp10 family phage protein